MAKLTPVFKAVRVQKSGMAEPYRLSVDEINYLVVAILVSAAAFTAFSGVIELSNSVFYIGVAAVVLGVREFGQRTIAQWMEAEVDLSLSMEGSIVTVFGAFLAVLTDLPIIMLFPVSNSFSVESYEHWGKGVDAMWLKREAWLTYGGIVALIIAGFGSAVLEMSRLQDAFFLFSAFQLLPFDNHGIPTGTLDGSYVLKQNGFYWLIFMFLSLAGFFFL